MGVMRWEALVLAAAFGAGYGAGRLAKLARVGVSAHTTIDLGAALRQAGLVLLPKETVDDLVDAALLAEDAQAELEAPETSPDCTVCAMRGEKH